MTTDINGVDLVQGVTEGGRKFGYVHGDDGGFFFTWMPTLDATLASVEEDEVDGDGGWRIPLCQTTQTGDDEMKTTKTIAGRVMVLGAKGLVAITTGALVAAVAGPVPAVIAGVLVAGVLAR